MHNTDNDEWFLEQVGIGRLSVSEDGVIINNDTKRRIGAMGSGGYPKISITKFKDDRGKWHIAHIQIHRLVWLVHRGKIPDGMQINHIDGNKSNPNVNNLELVTPSGNTVHAMNLGRLNLFQPGNKIFTKMKSYRRKHGLP